MTVRQAVIRERDYGTPHRRANGHTARSDAISTSFSISPYFGYFRAGTFLRKNTGKSISAEFYLVYFHSPHGPIGIYSDTDLGINRFGTCTGHHAEGPLVLL